MNKHYTRLLIIFFLFGLFVFGLGNSSPMNMVNEKKLFASNDLTIYPNVPPDLLDRARTANFIRESRYSLSKNATSIDKIFYRIGALRLLDPDLSNLTQSQKDYLISQILSFQNTNFGFGDWYKDRSSVTGTYKAVQSLIWLGYNGLNTANVKQYLDALLVPLTNSFKTYLSDSDGDLYATSIAVLTYSLLNEPVPSSTNVADTLLNGQNLDPSFVPPQEIGGFGLQTNSKKSIYWTSSVVLTSYALEALNKLGMNANDTNSAISFIKNLQLSNGGFVDVTTQTSSSASYSARAIVGLNLLGSSPVDTAKAASYLKGLQSSNGGYRLKDTSVAPSLKGTYFSLLGLSSLNVVPANITETVNYLVNLPDMVDGYGANPESEPNLRTTFDGVYSLVLMNRTITNKQRLLNYVESYRNNDNGFGLTGSYVESTFRAVTIYSLLNMSMPSASGVISFLQSLQQPDGGFSKTPGNTTSFVISTYRAIVALKLLGATPTNVNGAISYLKSTQNTDGGFGGYVGDISDVSSTYRAVRALSLLNDTSFDVTAAVSFLKNSQNPDGGFKRSSYDNALPNNVSHAIFTYSAVRALIILRSLPNNISGVYYYLKSLRNNDGGYGKHPDFTSDLAYTFSSLYVLSLLPEITGFKAVLPGNLDSLRSQYDNFSVTISSELYPMNYSISIANSSSVINSATINNASGTFVVDTSSFTNGMHVMRLTVVDGSFGMINQTFKILISNVIVTSSTSNSNTTSSTGTTSTTNSSSITTNSSTTTTNSSTVNITSNSTSSSSIISTNENSTQSSTTISSQPPPLETGGNNTQSLIIFVAVGGIALAVIVIIIFRLKK